MSDPNQFILHEDAQILDINQLSTRVRNRLPPTGGSHVLTRPGTRQGSMVLDEQGARLVNLLADGYSLTEALRQLANENQLPPEKVAQDAYPLIKTLLERQYLKKSGAPTPASSPRGFDYRFKPHDSFEGHTILKRVQVLDDTEVYQIRRKDGGLAALKLIRKPSKGLIAAFQREAMILKILGGIVTPSLFQVDLEGANKFIIMDWVDGEQSHYWAARARNLSPQERFAEILRMCSDVIQAYAILHEHGVIHSDIYSKNVLIRRDGSVRIVDFGYSFHPDVDASLGRLPRNTNPYFKSPDLALLELRDQLRDAPAPTIHSDVYSVGALLYLLITGATYIDFPLERTAVLRQTCESPMVPFSERGILGWDELERIVGRMLAKDPASRISSMTECYAELKQVRIPTTPINSSQQLPSFELAPTLAAMALQTEPEKPRAPSASIAYGGAGIAYALLIAAHTLKDHTLVPVADIWASYSRLWMESGPDGALCASLDITEEVLGPCAILHRAEGVALVEALIAHSAIDTLSLGQACLPFLDGIHSKKVQLEFVCGRAGLLNAIQQLSYLVVENQPLLETGHALADQMLQEISAYPSLSESPVKFVGFAHGWAGILYALVSWGKSYNQELVSALVPYLQELAQHRIQTRLGDYWPKRFDRPSEEGDNASWCNGTAGFVLLWAEAFAATQDRYWLDLARTAARHSTSHFESSISICCGLAGRAYALGVLASVSGDSAWLDAAHACLARATPDPRYVAGLPHSLLKGFVGLELARLELCSGNPIAFPTIASLRYGEPLPVGIIR